MINTFGGAPKNKSWALLRINLETLDFQVDFYWTPDKLEEKVIPMVMINSFKNMMGADNHSQFKPQSFFLRDCECERYLNHSSDLVLNWKTSKVEIRDNPLKLERFSIQRVTNDKIHLFEIVNTINTGCMIYYGSIANNGKWDPSTLKSYLKSLDPIILTGELYISSFQTEDLQKVIDKIETYIVFS